MTSAPDGPVAASPDDRRRSRLLWVSWLFGLSLVAAVLIVATHLAEERDFARLVERAQPLWLIAATVLQLGTYWADAQIWWRVLDRAGYPRPFGSLVGLGLAKLFMDQAVPSGGVSGTLLVVKGLQRRGVPRSTSMGAVLLDLRAYYAAYMTALAAALILLSTHQRLTKAIVLPAAVFFAYAAAMIGSLVYWSRKRERLRRAERLPLVKPLITALETASPAVARDMRLFLVSWGLELAIFLLDAMTLWAVLFAVGFPAHPGPVFASFMLSSLARTIGILPGGLGTFEAVSVATLGLMGVPIAAALAATLLFRGLSFWLPLVPGLILSRRESRLAAGAEPGRSN